MTRLQRQAPLSPDDVHQAGVSGFVFIRPAAARDSWFPLREVTSGTRTRASSAFID